MFFDFFFKYLQCHNILGLWKKYFPLFGKRVSEGLSNLPLRVHNRDFWGEKFLLMKTSTFYYDWSEFRTKIFEHSTKKWVELPKLQFICPAEAFEKKNFLKRNNFIFSLGLPERKFGSSGEKCSGVRVGVCLRVMTADTTFYMSRETFWENALFWKVCSFVSFLDFGREFFHFFAWNFGGFVWTAQKKNLGSETFLKKFQNFTVIEFWSKKIGGVAETAFTCLAEVFESFFERKVLASLISHIHLVVLEVLVEIFRTEGCENCIPRAFIWKFWWKTNVLYKCNFSNSFWHWAKNVQVFGNGSNRVVKTALTCPEEDLGSFFHRKVSNFISIFEFSANSFKAFEKKYWTVFRDCILRVQRMFLRRKTFLKKCFWKKCTFLSFLDVHRLILEYLAKKCW